MAAASWSGRSTPCTPGLQHASVEVSGAVIYRVVDSGYQSDPRAMITAGTDLARIFKSPTNDREAIAFSSTWVRSG